MTVRIDLETKHMLKDVQDYTRERGKTVTIYPHSESDVERGKFNSIMKRNAEGIKMKAIVNASPNRYEIEKAGIKESVEILVGFATKDFTDRDWNYETIDTERWEMQTPEGLFKVKDKAQATPYGEVYLKINVGLAAK